MPPKKAAAPAKKAAAPAAKSKGAAGASKGASKVASKGAAAKPEPEKKTIVQPDPILVAPKEVAKVFIQDIGRKIRDSKEGPAAFLVDNEDGIASRFFPYSGVTVFEAVPLVKEEQPTDDLKERYRKAVAAALRQRKPLVIDIDSTDQEVFRRLTAHFDALQPGLMGKILDRSIIKDDWYTRMLSESDGDPPFLSDEDLDGFYLVVVTRNQTPSPELTAGFTFFKIDG